MNTIIIVGTKPPCPRCKLLTDLVYKKSELMGLDAEIIHISYTSEEASAIAKEFGLIPGTAHDVAEKAGMELNLVIPDMTSQKDDSINIENLDPNFEGLREQIKLVKYMDDRLRPFENKANEVGIMMTPTLVINGEIIHQGSVPGLAEIEEWLSKLIDRG